MIEMPENESRKDLDTFIAAFKRAVADTAENLHAAPRNTSVGRVDEVRAAKDLLLCWKDLRPCPRPRAAACLPRHRPLRPPTGQ